MVYVMQGDFCLCFHCGNERRTDGQCFHCYQIGQYECVESFGVEQEEIPLIYAFLKQDLNHFWISVSVEAGTYQFVDEEEFESARIKSLISEIFEEQRNELEIWASNL
jgi:hypothetical protein